MEHKRLKEKLEAILTLPDLPWGEDLTAQDCKQIYDILCKIEQGTLIELKYPLHKAVYFLRNGAVEEGVIVSFNYNRYTNPKMWYSIEYYIPALKSYYVEVVREDMVYPTREEVEKRLKGAQE